MWHQVPYSAGSPYPAEYGLPAGHIAYRPFLVTHLKVGPNRVSCLSLLDSGADHCVFPLSFALLLGFNPVGAPQVMTGGIGSAAVPMYYWTITVHFGPAQFDVLAGFTEDMNSKGFGLLGQHGFFEHFKVQFDLPNRVFWIEVPDQF
jgi:hypothetical protein